LLLAELFDGAGHSIVERNGTLTAVGVALKLESSITINRKSDRTAAELDLEASGSDRITRSSKRKSG